LAAITAGLQLAGATASETRDARHQREAGHVELGHAGLPIPRRMAATAPVDAVVDSLIEEGNRAVVLIENEAGEPVGIVRLTNLRRARRAEWDHRAIGAIMTPVGDLLMLPRESTLFDALVRLDETGQEVALVAGEKGWMLVVTRSELLARLAAREHGDDV
jgi:CBS domain-containing protein